MHYVNTPDKHQAKRQNKISAAQGADCSAAGADCSAAGTDSSIAGTNRSAARTNFSAAEDSRHEPEKNIGPKIGIILAGGLSSRMGTNKAMLKMPDGKTLLEKCHDTLAQCHLDQIYVSGTYSGYNCLQDLKANMGPFGAMYTASQLLDLPSRCLFIPVDMPLMSPDILNPLLEIPTQFDSACYRQTCLPFVLHMNSTIQSLLEVLYLTCNQEKSLSIRYVLDLLNTHQLDTNRHDKNLINVNTPTQWKLFLKRFTNHCHYEYSSIRATNSF